MSLASTGYERLEMVGPRPGRSLLEVADYRRVAAGTGNGGRGPPGPGHVGGDLARVAPSAAADIVLGVLSGSAPGDLGRVALDRR